MLRPRRLLPALLATAAGLGFAAAGPTGDGPRESSYLDGAGLTLVQGPQISDPGAQTEASVDADYPVELKVAGVGAGQPVQVQEWSDGGWRTGRQLRTSDSGAVRFLAQGRTWYRAVARVDGEVRAARFSSSLTGPQVWLSEDFDDEVFEFDWMTAEQPPDTASCSRADPAESAVRDGVLALSVRSNPAVRCALPGQVGRTNGHYSVEAIVGPGTVATRMRFPDAGASVGRAWLQPAGATSPWVVDAEHEGVLIVGSAPGRPGRLETGIRWLDPETAERRSKIKAIPRELAAPGDGMFHVFSVEWRPDAFVFRVDGRVVNIVRHADVAFPQTIGLAALSPDSLTFGPTSRAGEVEVDWVRVYAVSTIPRVARGGRSDSPRSRGALG